MLLEDEKLSYSLFRRNNSLFWRKHFPVLICREFVRKTLKLIRELMSKIAKPANKVANSLFSVRHRALPDLQGMKSRERVRLTVFNNLLSS